MEHEKLYTKKDLQEAFDKGKSYDYRPTLFPSFNKWFNKQHLNLLVSCDTCEFLDQKHYKKCKDCVNCNLYQQNKS